MAENEERTDEDDVPQTRYRESEEDMSFAADADDTLSPGSMPGGPEYPEEETEGTGASEPLP